MEKYLKELSVLAKTMKHSRELSHISSNLAYELRQKAVRLQFEAAAATETAALAVEVLSEISDPGMLLAIMETTKIAAERAVDAIQKAHKAVEEANEADKKADDAFLLSSEAAETLARVLRETEQRISGQPRK